MRPSFWKMNEIIDIVRDGEKKTAICIGRDDFGLPKHLMQGTKQDGIISDGHSLSSWYWDGLCVIEGMRYVYFSPCEIHPIYDISTYSRPKALKIVRNLAFALSTAKEDYLDLITGVFPLYRIWIYGEDSILIMPPDLGDLIGIMRDEETKENEVNRIIQGTAEKQFLLITEMAELLYYAATGIFPFASDEVRGSGYREVPVSYFEKLPEKTEGFISFIFHAKSREMRDIMGNGSGGECLGWFLSKSRDLEWNLPPRTEEERDASIKKTRESEAYSTYFAERTRIYKRNTFWRTKGTAIGIVAVIVFFERFVDAIPRAELTGFLVREDQLTFFVFGRFHIHFHFVTDFEVGVVTEFAAGDHPFGFETDVHEHFAFVDRGNGTFHYFASLDVREGLVVLFGDLFFRFATVDGSFGFKCVPVELIDGDRGVRRLLSLRFFCVCSHFVVCWNETKRVRHYVLTPCNSTRLPKGVAKVRYFFNLQAVADIFPGTKHLVAVFCWRPEIFADNIFGTEGRPRSGTR